MSTYKSTDHFQCVFWAKLPECERIELENQIHCVCVWERERARVRIEGGGGAVVVGSYFVALSGRTEDNKAR